MRLCWSTVLHLWQVEYDRRCRPEQDDGSGHLERSSAGNHDSRYVRSANSVATKQIWNLSNYILQPFSDKLYPKIDQFCLLCCTQCTYEVAHTSVSTPSKVCAFWMWDSTDLAKFGIERFLAALADVDIVFVLPSNILFGRTDLLQLDLSIKINIPSH